MRASELIFFLCVCRHVSIRGFKIKNRVCLSVSKKRNSPSFVNISPALVIDAINGLHEYYSMEIQKFEILIKKMSEIELWRILPCAENHLSFVNISHTLVIDSSMERSSWVLQHGNTKKLNYFFKKKFEIEFYLVLKSLNHLSFVNISPYISNWYINGRFFMSTTT